MTDINTVIMPLDLTQQPETSHVLILPRRVEVGINNWHVTNGMLVCDGPDPKAVDAVDRPLAAVPMESAWVILSRSVTKSITEDEAVKAAADHMIKSFRQRADSATIDDLLKNLSEPPKDEDEGRGGYI